MQIMLFPVLFSLLMLVMLAILQEMIRLDQESGINIDREAIGILLLGSGIGTGYIVCCGKQPVIWMEYLMLAVYLTVCTVTDRQICKVYDFLQPPAAAAGAVICLLQSLPPMSGVVLILFALLQYLLFMRLYGKGDGMAFQICSLYIIGGGGSFETLLTHMALSFGMLGIIQFFRGNINRRGNLKSPVPFIPYIACSVLWCL